MAIPNRGDAKFYERVEDQENVAERLAQVGIPCQQRQADPVHAQPDRGDRRGRSDGGSQVELFLQTAVPFGSPTTSRERSRNDTIAGSLGGSGAPALGRAECRKWRGHHRGVRRAGGLRRRARRWAAGPVAPSLHWSKRGLGFRNPRRRRLSSPDRRSVRPGTIHRRRMAHMFSGHDVSETGHDVSENRWLRPRASRLGVPARITCLGDCDAETLSGMREGDIRAGVCVPQLWSTVPHANIVGWLGLRV